MPDVNTNWPSNWSLTEDENIENVERIKLTPEAQRDLGCTVGRDVFLEYPWAYVFRDNVIRLAEKTGSSLEIHKDRIKTYETKEFLVGYNGKALTSTEFVICLSLAARDRVRIRNQRISREIFERVVRTMEKKFGDWNSLRSDVELNKNFVTTNRPFIEIELSLPASGLNRSRRLNDRDTDQVRDGYIEILPGRREYRNVGMKMISRQVQTNLENKETSVQSYFGNPQNKWTQHDEVNFVNSDETQKTDENPEESIRTNEALSESAEIVENNVAEIVDREISKSPETELDVFLKSRSNEMTNLAKYNSVVNVHTDDIDDLAKTRIFDSLSETQIGYEEIGCYIFLGITKDKLISNVCWHPTHSEYFAVSYVSVKKNSDPKEINIDGETVDSISNLDSAVLIWSEFDLLRPKLLLQDVREIHSVSFCPYREDVVIGGSGHGQIVVWDVQGHLNDATRKDETDCVREDDEGFPVYRPFHKTGVPTIESVAASDMNNSQILPIRSIRWLPSTCAIEPTGNFTKLVDSTSMQFMTASEDGSVAFWDLLCQPTVKTSAKSLRSVVTATMTTVKDLRRLDNVFHPHFRIHVKTPKESVELTVLDACLASGSVLRDARSQPPTMTDDEDPAKRVWLGTAEGRFILGTWRGREFVDEPIPEVCDFIDESRIHDGPVLRVARCPQVDEVLLTIGGRVLAIWKDDYLRAPLLRRRQAKCTYTGCCWSNVHPGVFHVARNDGHVETWDVSRRVGEPVNVTNVSGCGIVGFYGSRDSFETVGRNVIGVCDSNGGFRMFEETPEDPAMTEKRLRWFSNYVAREISMKKKFRDWERDYLTSDEKAVERRARRAADDARKRHEEAKRKYVEDQENLERSRAERRAGNVPKSKDALRRNDNLEVAKNILLRKKGFDPKKLDEDRSPLVQRDDEKKRRFDKAEIEMSKRNDRFVEVASFEFPNCLRGEKLEAPERTEGTEKKSKDEIVQEDLRKYEIVREECRKMLEQNSGPPKFDWNTAMANGRRRKELINV